ncbi:hypothetical protein ACFL4L_00990 [bacterium]
MQTRQIILVSLISVMFVMNLVIGNELKKVIIRGWVESYEWNENDEIVQISILVRPSKLENGEELYDTEPYEDYVVVDDAEGRELLPYVGSFTEVRGTLVSGEDDIKMITVKSFKILKEEPETYIDVEILED